MTPAAVPAEWLRLAFAPPRALGPPPAHGRLRVVPEDFVVDEELGFEAAGDGPHVLLRVRKRGANTDWVARQLARLAGCRAPDVGFAGLKDRHAVTTQWFTVPAGHRAAADWIGLAGTDFAVLEACAHRRKLPRGALKRNHFVLRIRDCVADRDVLAARVAAMVQTGVPNYFGPQRFGRAGANLLRAAQAAAEPGARRREAPLQRSFRLSAARSLIFNAILTFRVEEGSWGRLEVGDVANLDERGTVFGVDSGETGETGETGAAVAGVPEALAERCRGLELHPTGCLWGRGELASRGRIAALETACAAGFEALRRMLEEAGLEQERRSLRLAVRGLEVEWDGADLLCRFALPPGAYATTVLRELLDEPVDAG